MTLHKSFPIALLALLAFLSFLVCAFLTFACFLVTAMPRPVVSVASPATLTPSQPTVMRPVQESSTQFAKRVDIGRGNVKDVAWRPDGSAIAVTGNMGTWLYTPTFRDMAYLPDARLSHFSPDGQWLAGIDPENRLTLWNVPAAHLSVKLLGHQNPVKVLQWSPDSQRIASLDSSGHLLIWDVARRQAVAAMDQPIPDRLLLQWSLDANQLAVEGVNGTIWVWQANTGVLEAQIPTDTLASPAYLLWGPDGKTIFRSTYQGEFSNVGVTKLDIKSGKTLFDVSFGTGQGTLILSPDRTQLAVVAQNIELVDVATGKTLKTLMAHTRSEDLAMMSCAAWSPDGRRLAAGDTDWQPDRDRGTIYLWDIATGDQLGKLVSGQAGIENLSWNAAGDTLVSSSRDNAVQTWDMAGIRPLNILNEHRSVSGLIAWKSDWSKVAATDGNTLARVWDTRTGQQVATLSGHDNPITTLVWKPGPANILTTSSGKELAYQASPELIRLWDADTGLLLDYVRGPNWAYDTGQVSSLVWSTDGSRLFITNYDGRLMVWNATSKALQRFTFDFQVSHARNAQLNPTGQKVTAYLSWSGGACVSVWNWEDGRKDAGCVSWRGGCGGGSATPMYADTWTPDGKQFLSASWLDSDPNTSLAPMQGTRFTITLQTLYDATLAREKLADVTPLQLNHDAPIRAVAWSTNREYLASFSDDNLLHLWRASTGELLTKLATRAVRKIVWSPIDDNFLTIDEGGTVLLWGNIANVEGYAWESKLLAKNVAAANWHPDGKLIAVTSTRDNTIRLINPQGVWLDNFVGIGGELLWSPDSTRLSQVNDGMIAIWSAK